MWLSPLCLLPYNFFQLLTYGDPITCSYLLAERTVFNCQSSSCMGMCDPVELSVLQSNVQDLSTMTVHILSIFVVTVSTKSTLEGLQHLPQGLNFYYFDCDTEPRECVCVCVLNRRFVNLRYTASL